jgi:hypothetical protein
MDQCAGRRFTCSGLVPARREEALSTPETQQTSFVAGGLPPNQTLYARLWTQVGGIWRFVDTTFTVAAVTATYVSSERRNLRT